MMAKDYYNILGIGKNASKEEIKRAYKKLVKQYHPDINPNVEDKEKIKEINEAYSVLGDDNKRTNYGKFGTAGEQFAGFEGVRGFNFEDVGFGDIFEEFFGGFTGRKRTRRKYKRGMDIAYNLNVNFEEAAFGTEKKVNIPRFETCQTCEGTGAKNQQFETCQECNGSGTSQKMFRTPFGTITQSTTCPNCSGEGKIIKERCFDCGGKGKVKKVRTITVKIPAGVDNGSALKMEGEGEAGENAPSGSLYIEINVKPHKIFEREGNDILLEVPISFTQAALGDTIKVPTLKGNVSMKIPNGTQTNTTFRLKGKGIQYLDSYGMGDQHITIIVKTPTKLNKKQKQLLKELAKNSKEKLKIEKNSPSFFNKVKNAFGE